MPGAAHITKPDTEKDAELPVHRGAAAVIDGTERTFLDRYGDYFWFALLLLSGIGSAGAWLRHYLNRDERDENTSHRNRILAMVSRVRTGESNKELLAMQRVVSQVPVAPYLIRYAMRLARQTRKGQGGVPDFIERYSWPT